MLQRGVCVLNVVRCNVHLLPKSYSACVQTSILLVTDFSESVSYKGFVIAHGYHTQIHNKCDSIKLFFILSSDRGLFSFDTNNH